MNLHVVGIFLVEGALVILLILFLFRLRKIMGLGLLFACLGLFQFMQVVLSSTVYYAVTKSILVSPGSSVLFTASLFAILLIYIKEDATETRKIIYALVITNIVMSILLEMISWNIEDSFDYNPLHLSTNFFDNNSWTLLVGTLSLFIDSILIIVIYEFISRHLTNLFVRICLTMLIVISFDTLFFSIGAFWNYTNLDTIITSGLLSKGVFAIFYSVFVYFYLIYIEKDVADSQTYKIKDVFQTLSYRQKFEISEEDKRIAKEEILLKELKYQTLTNISPVGVFHARSDGYTTYVNPKWCDISGLSVEESLGDEWLNTVHPEDIQIVKDGWKQAISLKKKSDSEYRFVQKDGSIRWVLWQAVPEINSQNIITGFVGTITDITDLKQYQHEQTELRLKAEESDKLKTAFLANMSHEIRTPMNGILGFSELLKNPFLKGDQQQEYIGIIEESGERMLNIINDLVDISKIEAGLIKVQNKNMEINEKLEYIYNFFKPQVEKKRMQLFINNTLPAKEAIINTDSEKFYSILTNLVKNAIKFSEEGAIEIGYNKKGDNLEFYVKDTGIGIPKDRQEAIFERFIQADIADKMARQGAGLGLSITKAFVEMLGGKIWVESEEGIGSTFYFTLPYNVESKEKNGVKKNIATNKVEPEVSGLKILIAEDDEPSSMLISETVKDFSKEVIEVRTGNEAVEFSKNNPDVDLIMMDIQMPDLNGYEATRQIRQFNKDIVIIAQTSFGLSGDREKAIAAGCNDYIPKPINNDELLSLIQKYFKK
jgi:PAS domain S-box-containing protein